MKKSVLVLLLMMAIPLFSSGQNDSAKVKLYFSWYDLNSAKTRQSDLFTYEFTDSTVTVVARDKYKVGFIPEVADLRIFPVEDINKMLFRKKGRKVIGLVTGVTGAIIGGIVGNSFGSNTVTGVYGDELFRVSAGFKAFTGAIIGGGIGIAIGMPIGSAKKVFRVNGDVRNYQEMRPDLSKYSISYYTK